MKSLIEKIIRLRNPAFSFDPALNTTMLLQSVLTHFMSLIRSMKMIFKGRRSKGMLLGRNVRFQYTGKIQWGKFLRLGDQVFISALGKSGIRFGNNVSIGAFSRVVVSTSMNHIGEGIELGNNVGIGEFAYLGGGGGL